MDTFCKHLKTVLLLINEVAAHSQHFDFIAPFINVRTYITYLLTYNSEE